MANIIADFPIPSRRSVAIFFLRFFSLVKFHLSLYLAKKGTFADMQGYLIVVLYILLDLYCIIGPFSPRFYDLGLPAWHTIVTLILLFLGFLDNKYFPSINEDMFTAVFWIVFIVNFFQFTLAAIALNIDDKARKEQEKEQKEEKKQEDEEEVEEEVVVVVVHVLEV